MNELMIILCLIVGIIFIIAGSNIMIEGARDLAKYYHKSALAIGLTIVAFGTSIPELLVSYYALHNGYSNIVIYNLIGSNIINILLILSISSLIKPLKITSSTIKKELPLSIFISAIFVFLSLDDLFIHKNSNILSRFDAVILILLFILYVGYLLKLIHTRKDVAIYEPPKYSCIYSIVITVLGLAMIFVGSIFTVDMAQKITTFGISDKLISATVIAFATSVPELVTCLHLIKHNNEDMIVGNILGSNIFNICIAITFPVIILGNLNMNGLGIIDAINFLIASIILVIFAPIKNKIGKFEGVIMISILMIYFGYIIWEGLGL